MKLSAKVLSTVLSMGIAMAHDSQEHGFQRFLIEKDDRPSMANGLNRTVLDANNVQDMEEDGFARFLGEDGPDNSKGIWLTVILSSFFCLGSLFLCIQGSPANPNVTPLMACCGIHFLIMTCMLIFGGFFLWDAFDCDQCLYFAVGPEKDHVIDHAASFRQSTAQESIGIEAKGYTGTLGQNLDKLLGYNARNFNLPEDILDRCGIWIFHPDQWTKLGQTIEIDATIGQGQISSGGTLSASRSDGIFMEAMTSTKSASDCKVSFGTDNKLRNYKDGGVDTTTIIGEGNCKEVKYLNDRDKSKGQFDLETVIRNRKVYANVGVVIFVLIRILQYTSLFMVLGSDTKHATIDEPDVTDDFDGFKNFSKWLGKKVWERALVVLDGVFYTQMPMFMLEPLTGTNLIQDCDAILAFRFNPTMWIVAAVFSGLGAFIHGVDLCLRKVGGGDCWKVVKTFIGFILFTFVAVIKFLQIQRFGLTVVLSLTFKWGFNFEFWPLSLKMELDMFQIFACLFQICDIFFAIYSGWLKYVADAEERKEAAGIVGEVLAVPPKDEDNEEVLAVPPEDEDNEAVAAWWMQE